MQKGTRTEPGGAMQAQQLCAANAPCCIVPAGWRTNTRPHPHAHTHAPPAPTWGSTSQPCTSGMSSKSNTACRHHVCGGVGGGGRQRRRACRWAGRRRVPVPPGTAAAARPRLPSTHRGAPREAQALDHLLAQPTSPTRSHPRQAREGPRKQIVPPPHLPLRALRGPSSPPLLTPPPPPSPSLPLSPSRRCTRSRRCRGSVG